jgi:hypothetical protein
MRRLGRPGIALTLVAHRTTPADLRGQPLRETIVGEEQRGSTAARSSRSPVVGAHGSGTDMMRVTVILDARRVLGFTRRLIVAAETPAHCAICARVIPDFSSATSRRLARSADTRVAGSRPRRSWRTAHAILASASMAAWQDGQRQP